jgi:biopolymer transport protein ExbD
MGPVNRRSGLLAEVNVTPLADVMIVLLVIFMVATSMINRVDRIVLPAGRGKAPKEPAEATVILRSTGWTVDGAAALSATDLQVQMMSRSLSTGSVRVLADQSLPYRDVAAALEAIRGAGAGEVLLVVEERPPAAP